LVKLEIFNELGINIENIINKEMKAGVYEVRWDGSKYPSGVYYYRLTARNFSETKKMILVK
jgi:flagellar hook assembly protein FlgD